MQVNDIHEDELGVIFDALRHRVRRQLLVRLLEHNPQQEEELSVLEDIPTSAMDRNMLQVQLIHIHLPKLEHSGFIQWEKTTHEIERGPKFDDVKPLVRLIHEHRADLPAGWV